MVARIRIGVLAYIFQLMLRKTSFSGATSVTRRAVWPHGGVFALETASYTASTTWSFAATLKKIIRYTPAIAVNRINSP